MAARKETPISFVGVDHKRYPTLSIPADLVNFLADLNTYTAYEIRWISRAFLNAAEQLALQNMLNTCSTKEETIVLVRAFFTSLEKDWSEDIMMSTEIDDEFQDLELEEEPIPLVRQDLSAAILREMTALQIRVFAHARLTNKDERRAYEIELSKVETKDDLIALTLAFLNTARLEKSR